MSAAVIKMIAEESERIPAPTRAARPMGIRIATERDEKPLFDLLMLLGDENAMDPINDGRVHAMIMRATRRDGGIIGIIDAPDGTIAATVGIVMTQWWYSEAWHCEEVWSFVHPAHRKGTQNYAKRLIEFSKWWGEQLGMPVLMGVLSTKRTLGKVRLYARSIRFVGALFLHRGGVV